VSRNAGIAALAGAGKLSELRQRIFFVLGALVVFRIGTFISLPGIDAQVMEALFEQSRGSILDMFNMFSGGALERMSIFALGVMPYISASIIVQLLTVVVPSLEQLKKEGDAGRRKITQYTRYGTLGLALFQALGVSIALQGQQVGGESLVINAGYGFLLTATLTLVTGTMLLVWLGEQITERGIGNGISLIIFAGIVAGLPSAIGGTFELVRTGEMNLLVLFLLIGLAVAVTGFVIFVERGQRRITVNYAKRQQGGQMMGAQTSPPAAQVEHGGRHSADFRLEHHPVPGDPGRLVRSFGGYGVAQEPCRHPVSRAAVVCDVLCRGDHFLRLLLHRAGLQRA